MTTSAALHNATLTLRAAKRSEADRLLAFYEANPNPFLLPRPFKEFSTAIERGQFFVVTDGEEIVAASGIFDYGDEQPYVELAETFVAPAARGFGIQRIFFMLRIGSVVLFQGPSVTITTAVDGRNPRSLANAAGQGFERWSDPISEAYASCPTCPNRSEQPRCCCDFYRLPIVKAREAVRALLDATTAASVQLQHSSGATLKLVCDCPITAGEQRLALEDFALGTVW
jgi:hypothetical protein